MRAFRWPPEVVIDLEKHVKAHPTFHTEELKDYLMSQFTDIRNTSESAICRVLNFDLQFSRNKLIKAAREASPEEMQTHFDKLRPICSFPEKLNLY